MKTIKTVVFVVKWYAVCRLEIMKYRYTVHKKVGGSPSKMVCTYYLQLKKSETSKNVSSGNRF